MENVFEDMLTEGTAVDETKETEFDHSYDLSDEDLASPEDNETLEKEEGASETVEEPVQNPTNQAFAQMRVQNNEYSQKISELDNLAKSLGLNGVDDLIVKAKEAQVQREAKQKGIPTEVAQELAEIRELKESIIAEREHAMVENKERAFVSNVEDFIKANQLPDSTIDKLSQDLEKDGLEIETLMGMPKSALNRILSSYIDVNQKNLDRKSAIKKELPINQSSKIDNKVLNKEIDALARQLAGK
jgi:hypothetical protein